MRYKGAPLRLHKMMKLKVELEKSCIWSLIQNYEEIMPLITNVEASYAQLHLAWGHCLDPILFVPSLHHFVHPSIHPTEQGPVTVVTHPVPHLLLVDLSLQPISTNFTFSMHLALPYVLVHVISHDALSSVQLLLFFKLFLYSMQLPLCLFWYFLISYFL